MAAEAALAQLNDPARNAQVPTLVPKDALVGANALVGRNANLARAAPEHPAAPLPIGRPRLNRPSRSEGPRWGSVAATRIWRRQLSTAPSRAPPRLRKRRPGPAQEDYLRGWRLGT
jgi:hypothetical protein